MIDEERANDRWIAPHWCNVLIGVIVAMLMINTTLLGPLAPPTVDAGWTRADPGWNDLAVTPTSGTNDTTFTFHATYMDSANTGLYPTDEPMAMLTVYDADDDIVFMVGMNETDPADDDYTDGKAFSFSTNSTYTLGTGVYAFEVRGWAPTAPPPADGIGSEIVEGPTVGGWELAFFPASGTSRDLIQFTFDYLSPDNETISNVLLHCNADQYPMIPTDPGDRNYSDGKTFINATLLEPGTNWVHVTAQTGAGPISTTPRAIEINALPTLTNGSVTPTTGSSGTTFEYEVVYTDRDGDPAHTVTVTIDDTTYDMIAAENDSDVTDGKRYRYSTDMGAVFLADGFHTYSFAANDSVNWFYTAQTNATAGPVVGAAVYNLSVTPTTGLVGRTQFNFTAQYLDVDHYTPTSIECIVNHTAFPMQRVSDSRSVDGTRYYCNTTLDMRGSLEWYITVMSPRGTFTSDTAEVELLGTQIPTPEIVAYTPPQYEVALDADESLTFGLEIEPAYDFSIAYRLDDGVNTIEYPSENGSFILNGTLLSPGTFFLNATVANSLGQTATHSWRVTIETIYGTIAGVIENAEGDPLADVEVQISGGSATLPERYTDGEGRFIAELVVPGEYTVQAVKAGYYEAKRNITVEVGETTDLTLTLAPVPNGVFAGTIVDDRHNAVPHAELRFVNYQTGDHYTTNATAGTITPVEVLPGPYTVNVSADGYKPYNATGIGVGAGQRRDLTIVIQRITGTVTGRVEHEAGELFDAIVVVAVETGQSAPVNNDTGSFTLAGLSVGTYNISAYRHTTLLASDPAVAVAAHQTTDITLTIPSSIDIRDGWVEGEVTDTSAEPLAGVTIRVVDSHLTTATDTNGAYRLTLAPESYTLAFEKSGYETVEETATVEEGATVALDIELPPRMTTSRGTFSHTHLSLSYCIRHPAAFQAEPLTCTPVDEMERVAPDGYNTTPIAYRVVAATTVEVLWAETTVNYTPTALPQNLTDERTLALWVRHAGEWMNTTATHDHNADTFRVNASYLEGLWALVYQTGEGDQAGPDPDRIAPRIIPSLLQPAAKSDDVDRNTTIEVVFDRTMDPTSTETALELSPSTDWTTDWTDARHLIIIPTAPLAYATSYQVSIATTARGEHGLQLNDTDGDADGLYRWSFTTEEAPVTIPQPYREQDLSRSYTDALGDVALVDIADADNLDQWAYRTVSGVDILALSSYRSAGTLHIVVEISGAVDLQAMEYRILFVNRSFDAPRLISAAGETTPVEGYHTALAGSAATTNATTNATGNTVTFSIPLATLADAQVPANFALYCISYQRDAGTISVDAAGRGATVVDRDETQDEGSTSDEAPFPILWVAIIILIVGGVVAALFLARQRRARLYEYYETAEYDEEGRAIVEPEIDEDEYEYLDYEEYGTEGEPDTAMPEFEAPERAAARKTREERDEDATSTTGGEEALLDESTVPKRREPSMPSVSFETVDEAAETKPARSRSRSPRQAVQREEPERGAREPQAPPPPPEPGSEREEEEEDEAEREMSVGDLELDFETKKERSAEDDLFDSLFDEFD